MENIPMLERKTSKKNAYVKKEYTKGYKIPIISDVMFETMINNESRKKYAALIIASALKRNYKDICSTIEYVKNKLDKQSEIEKGREVDFICKLEDEYIGIEMNNNYRKELYERNISYAMDIYKSKEIRGSKYSFNKVVQINVNNFTFENNNKEVEEYALRNNEGEYLTEKIKIINIYLPIIRNKYYTGDDLSELDKIMLIFNEEDNEELSKLYEGDEILMEYVKDAKVASINDDIVGLYDKELHEELLRNTELYNAEQKGKKETAKNMLQKGLNIDFICDCTKLTLKEVESLKEEIKESLDNDEVALYDKELHEEKLRITELEEAREKGLAAGIAKGKKASILETAKKFLKEKVDIDIISKCTGLTKEEINSLR